MFNVLKRLLPIFFCFVLCTSPSTFAVQKEYVLKAGFLYNFAMFGQWHGLSKQVSPFIICSPDKQFVDTADEALKGREVNSRKLVNKYTPLNNRALESCDILFITDTTYTLWLSAQPLNLHKIMLVGESDGFIEANGHIRFFLSSNKVRFEIAPKKLKSSGITMSSKVLRLARVVEG